MHVDVGGDMVYVYSGSRPVVPGHRTLLFVHGAGMDHTVWIQQSRYFAHHGWNVLAPDLPGHGASGGTPPASVGDGADWCAGLLSACGIERGTIIGHSFGSLVALEAAARHPRNFDRAALLGCAAPMAVSDELLQAAEANDHAAIEMITGWGHSPRGQLGGNRAPGMWITGGATRLLERARPGVLHNDLAACNAYTTGLESAASLGVPVLLLLGSADQMTPPRAAAALETALTGVRKVVLPGCGHMLMAEQPDGVLDTLREFLGSV